MRRSRPQLGCMDRYLLPTGRSATNQPHAAAAVERWDRQTDGRTIQLGDARPDRYIDPAPHRPYYAVRTVSITSLLHHVKTKQSCYFYTAGKLQQVLLGGKIKLRLGLLTNSDDQCSLA